MLQIDEAARGHNFPGYNYGIHDLRYDDTYRFISVELEAITVHISITAQSQNRKIISDAQRVN